MYMGQIAHRSKALVLGNLGEGFGQTKDIHSNQWSQEKLRVNNSEEMLKKCLTICKKIAIYAQNSRRNFYSSQ
jgi:hypothetical protein